VLLLARWRVERVLQWRNHARANSLAILRHASIQLSKVDVPAFSELPDILSRIVGTFQTEQLDDLSELTDDVRAVVSILEYLKGPRQLSDAITSVIRAGALEVLVAMLQSESTAVNTASAALITAIAASHSEHTKAVVEAGAVPHLTALLDTANGELRNEVVWALGNVAGDSSSLRDIVLREIDVSLLLGITASLLVTGPTKHAGNAMWLSHNLCRGKPPPPDDILETFLEVSARAIDHPFDDVVQNGAWALACIGDRLPDIVIQTKCLPRLCEITSSRATALSSITAPPDGEDGDGNVRWGLGGEDRVLTGAIRVLGNLVTSTDMHTQAVLDAGALEALEPLLITSPKDVLKEVCWFISNITAGTVDQVGMVCSLGLVPPIVEHLRSNTCVKVRKESAWALANLATCGSPEHIQTAVDAGTLEAFVEGLDIADQRVASVILDGLEAIFSVSTIEDDDEFEEDERYRHYKCPPSWLRQFDDFGGLDALVHLSSHGPNQTITNKAEAIVSKLGGPLD